MGHRGAAGPCGCHPQYPISSSSKRMEWNIGHTAIVSRATTSFQNHGGVPVPGHARCSRWAPSFKEGERGSLSYPPTASANRVARPTYRLPPSPPSLHLPSGEHPTGYMLFDVTRDTVKKPTPVPVERNYSRADGERSPR